MGFNFIALLRLWNVFDWWYCKDNFLFLLLTQLHVLIGDIYSGSENPTLYSCSAVQKGGLLKHSKWPVHDDNNYYIIHSVHALNKVNQAADRLCRLYTYIACEFSNVPKLSKISSSFIILVISNRYFLLFSIKNRAL